MPSNYRRIFAREENRWPSGLPRAAATLRLTPEEFSARTGIGFQAGCDDLDSFRAAGVELMSGRRVLLLWYERAPIMDLELRIDSRDDPVAAREEALAAFGLSHDLIAWVPDDAKPAI